MPVCAPLAIVALCLAEIALPPRPRLAGLNAPGAGLQAVDPRAQALENDVLAAINARRQKGKQDLVSMDERLRAFARQQSRAAADGNVTLPQAEAQVKEQQLAPLGHRLQFTYGASPTAVLANLGADLATLISAEFSRAGVGAVWVPDKPPYFQVTLLFVQDPDAMVGKPGLSVAQTDPVMQAAEPGFVACYNAALKQNPNLRGDVVMQLVVGGGGRVHSVHLLRSLQVLSLDACLQGAAQNLTFPAPYKDRAVTLTHPMRFTPPQGDRKLGVLSQTQIQSAFAAAAGDFRSCYTERLKSLPKLAGTITLAAVVAGNGSFKALDVLHDEPADPVLTACVLGRAKQMRFIAPSHGGEVDITYPLRFGM